ncbi:hypothetical protein ACFL4T_05455 [candidate division KSB1 bacterium]
MNFVKKIISILLIFVSGSVFSQFLIPHYKYENDFRTRCDTLLYSIAKEVTSASFPSVAARLKTGIDVEGALTDLNQILDNPQGSIFYSYPLIGTYLYFKDMLPDDIKEKVKNVFRNTPIYRGDTENHLLMYYTSIYLAAQTFENLDRWFNGKSTQENLNEAKGFLNYWYDITFSKGQGEFDSPVYITLYINTMLLLTDFAIEDDIQIKSHMALDLVLVDLAAEYLNGIYGGAHSRIYQRTIHDDRYDDFSVFAYLYFGGLEKQVKSYGFIAALSGYRLPQIIYHIAQDRSDPYVHKEKKRVRNIIRFHDELNPPVYKYTYMTKDYVLGSLQGGILQPIQQHTWDLSFVQKRKFNTVFSLHPYYSGYELAMFFPERLKIMTEDVVQSKGTYNKEDKWTGSSPYERTFQHENTIIVLYNIDPDDNVKHIDAYFPKSLDNLERTELGWIFGNGGNIYFAYLPLKSYDWTEEENGYRLRSPFLKNGLIFEVSSKDKYSSFEEFKRDIIANPLDYTNFDDILTVQYQNSSGESLKFTYPDKRHINDKEIDFTEYKLFESPYVFSEVESKKIEIRYQTLRRVLDINNLRIEDYIQK